jgi:hypothetical protein
MYYNDVIIVIQNLFNLWFDETNNWTWKVYLVFLIHFNLGNKIIMLNVNGNKKNYCFKWCFSDVRSTGNYGSNNEAPAVSNSRKLFFNLLSNL